MIFQKCKIPGVMLIKPELHADERGFFARTWCEEEFKSHRLNPSLKQCSSSFNHKKGTLRGMHMQVPPFGECKLIRCVTGRVYDVALDMRPCSPTYMTWESFHLTQGNREMLYLPDGIAHGFQTLEDNTELFYQISESFQPHAAVGYRYNDPAFGIHWPLVVSCISTKDMNYASCERVYSKSA